MTSSSVTREDDLVARLGFPFRMMWFTPVLGLVAVLAIGVVSAAVGVRLVLKLEPAVVFAGR